MIKSAGTEQLICNRSVILFAQIVVDCGWFMGKASSIILTTRHSFLEVSGIISPIFEICGKLMKVRYMSDQWVFKVLEHSKCLRLKMEHDN